MPAPNAWNAVSYVPNCDPDAAQQVLTILERWRQRTEDHFSNNRRDHRFPYPNRALVVCQATLGEEPGEGTAAVALEVHARNLSCGGMSLLAPPVFVAEQAGENTPPLRSERLLAVGREISIGLYQAKGEILWMRGAIVRSRLVHFGFRECGISFLSKLAPPQGNPAPEAPPPPSPVESGPSAAVSD